jgi:hypothetical protein
MYTGSTNNGQPTNNNIIHHFKKQSYNFEPVVHSASSNFTSFYLQPVLRQKYCSLHQDFAVSSSAWISIYAQE